MECLLAELKKDNTEAAEWLLFYDLRKKHVIEKRSEVFQSTYQQEVAVSSGPGNPTMRKALQLVDMSQSEEWLKTVELVEAILGEKKRIFLKYRRQAVLLTSKERGRPQWVVYVQHHYADEMANRYNTSPEKFWLGERTLKTWWQEIVELMARVATKKGLL